MNTNINNSLYEVTRCDAVYIWTYDAIATDCAICRYLLIEDCTYCLSNEKYDGCSISEGKCYHTFHSHCINK